MTAVAEAGASSGRRWASRALSVLGVGGTVAFVVLVVMLLSAVLAPWLAPYDPNYPDLMASLQGPSPAHPLGTDALGRDLLSRLMFGGRTTLLGPLLVIGVSTFVGCCLAFTASWRGGLADAVISRLIEVLFSIPSIVFALVAVAVLGVGLLPVVAGLIIAYTPYVARVMRGAALRERRLPYISAVWIQGRSGPSITAWQLVPNLRPLIVAQAVSALGFAVVDVAAVSFLGLGVQPPTPDWGLMVKSGLDSALRGQPTEVIVASAAIVLFVGAVTVVGDRLGRGVTGR